MGKRRMELPAEELFPADSRDSRPGTHFAEELGSAPRPRRQRRRDAHVDEDLGCSAFGIDLPFVRR